MNETIFTRIIKREIPATIVHEDEETIAILDISPVAKGHTLLITKEPHTHMQDVPDVLLGNTFIKAKKLMHAIKAATGCDLVQIVVEGKDVPHFHIHLIPRFNNDGFPGWPKTHYAENEMQIIANKIKDNI
jgi:histidine triad (HIT) family protein